MFASYLELAWKVLWRRKFFTFASLFGVSFTLLVLTLGAVLLDHVFAAHPPESRLERTLGLYGLAMVGEEGMRTGWAGWAFLDRYARDLPGAERVSFIQLQRGVAAYAGERQARAMLKRTDGAFWQILDFELLEGEPFTEEDQRQARPVAVINESTRKRLFGDVAAVGRSIEVDGQRFRVVGVVRDVPVLRFFPYADIWVPISTTRSDSYKSEYVADFVALIEAPPEAHEALRAEMDHRIATAVPPDPQLFQKYQGGLDTPFEFFSRMTFGRHHDRARPGVLAAVLTALALLFMALPAINLVNLNVSRILERSSEIGVRRAFGASRATLVGQLLVENLVLSAIGGAAGLLLTVVVLRAVELSGAIPYAQLGLNVRVFLWSALFTVVFGLLSGLYPAWRMARLQPVDALRGSS
jgi:putative ABC transport system permease protein